MVFDGVGLSKNSAGIAENTGKEVDSHVLTVDLYVLLPEVNLPLHT